VPRTALSRTVYEVRYAPQREIVLDGRPDEAGWRDAAVERKFAFPWKRAAAPPTEFRALCDDRWLYFSFRIQDADVFVLDELRDEEDAVFEDRAEMYFARDDALEDYFCLEIDSRGRVFDYRGSYYRQLDPQWNWPGVEARASTFPGGYAIEGRISQDSFKSLGFPPLRPDARIRCGLYRAEFSHDRSGKPPVQQETIHNRGRRLNGPPPLEEWISWIDPQTKEPDFHVPSSFGWLRIVE